MPPPARSTMDENSGHRDSIQGDADEWPVSVEWSTRMPGAMTARPFLTRVRMYDEAAIAEALKFSRTAKSGRCSSIPCSNRDSLERRTSAPPSNKRRSDREYVQSARYMMSL